MTWQQALITAAIALATAIAAGWFNKPKTKGEGRQAEGSGEKSLAEARQLEQIETLRQTREAADRADRARENAEIARDSCQARERQMRVDFEAFADVIEELIPFLPEGEQKRKARVALRAARLAI